ncbi:hypothetical protein Athai_46240 [Actinocatenispora thailandica]|uniref:Uncharacterized protein n=1 Tax=Actinocatenispora thailandica TaxID=227318 RepID=A0A7R7DSV1_9ACTN|nr:hypothetical protein [Actinocatenispora thailandica]BCJ37121.1 hypothetical protein Athai_46240 [Actinocatenispora thailandica]
MRDGQDPDGERAEDGRRARHVERAEDVGRAGEVGRAGDVERAESDGAEPVIELDAAQRTSVGRADSRSVPRRYLVLAAVALLVLGFAAGVLTQRARTPKPPPAATSHLGIPEVGIGFVASGDVGGCHSLQRGYHEAGVVSVCTGTLRRIRHTGTDWRLTIVGAGHTVHPVLAHDDTAVLPGGSVADLRVGMKLRVSGRGILQDNAFHAVAISRE